MADSYTSNRDIILPQVGSDSGTWGTLLNNQAFAQLDLILGATQAISITSADVTLSTPQWNNCAIKLTGALTGDHSLILPYNVNSSSVAVGGLFVVDNETTGAHKVTVITSAAGSTGVVVPQGVRTWLYSDTTNVWYADDAAAHIIPWNGNPNGYVAGTAGSFNNPPSIVWDYTNSLLYFCVTTGNAAGAVWQPPAAAVLRGFDTAANLQLVATHTGGNLLNVAVKAANINADPTTGNPVIVKFQTTSGSNTTGAPATVNISSALSINTYATGATLGSVNSIPFRLWIAIFNNAGTPVLALRNCSTTSSIFPLAEYGVASTVSISGGATSAGVWYTPNGVSLTNCAFRVVGYLVYVVGLATAGSYTSDPNNVVLFGPGVNKPGDTIQTVYATTASQTTATNSTFVATSLSTSIATTSSINPVLTSFSQFSSTSSATAYSIIQLLRGSTGVGQPCELLSNSGAVSSVLAQSALDLPYSLSPVTYATYLKAGGSYNAYCSLGTLILQEIMG